MHRPWKLLAVDDEDFVISAQFAEAGASNVGELHLGVLGSGGALRSFDDVLPPAAGGLGHLVVLAALWIVEFLAGLAVIEREKAAAESQGLELHNRGQRERMQLAEAAVFIEQLWHGGVLGGQFVGRD